MKYKVGVQGSFHICSLGAEWGQSVICCFGPGCDVTAGLTVLPTALRVLHNMKKLVVVSCHGITSSTAVGIVWILSPAEELTRKTICFWEYRFSTGIFTLCLSSFYWNKSAIQRFGSFVESSNENLFLPSVIAWK